MRLQRIWIVIIFALIIQSCSSTKFVTNGDIRSIEVQFDNTSDVEGRLKKTLNYIRDVDGIRGSTIKIVIYKTNSVSFELNNMCLDIIKEYGIVYRNRKIVNLDKVNTDIINQFSSTLSSTAKAGGNLSVTDAKQQIKMLASRYWNLKVEALKSGDAGIGSNSNDIHSEDKFEGDVILRFEVAPEGKKNNEGVVYYEYRK